MNDTLIQKVQSCQRCIQRARGILAEHRADFASNHDAQDAAVLNLIRVCELSIDIANLLIRRDKLGIPASSAESFDLLQQAGQIEPDLGGRLKAMVGFRNIAVHQYRELDYEIVTTVIERGLDDVVHFLDHLAKTA